MMLGLHPRRSVHPWDTALSGHVKVASGLCLGAALPGSERGPAAALPPEEMVQVVAGCGFLSLTGNVTLLHIKRVAPLLREMLGALQPEYWEGAGPSEKTRSQSQ